ncbi:RRP15-like protein isoform X2 [Oppia nitens]|nr:RRP15-like protein isoform X2 [Oppia nitens]
MDSDVDPKDLDLDDIIEDSDDLNEDDAKDLASERTSNIGWADAINKVLAVKPKNKSFIMSKAKKDKDLKRKDDDKEDNVEIVNKDGTVVKSDDNNETSKKKMKKTNETNAEKLSKLSKTQWETMGRLKPTLEDWERERRLCSIATKGVVQLFNAVREQQKTIDRDVREVGSSETRRDRVINKYNKNQFLDKLKEKQKKDKTNDSKESDKKEEKTWKVLRDDFMIGAKMKDWDKQSDSEEEDIID